ncbi:MAG: hypothetical protein KKB34_09295 [Bacteroidetes bacterium]|nr:hypothetical protein [Bacteroidota bacterium]
MKIKNVFFFLLVTSSLVFAQKSPLSVGIVTTHFHNNDSNDRLSSADNPYGYGAVVSYKLADQFSLAFTGVYSNSDIENISGEETAFRGHLSIYIMPYSLGFARPYFSGGIVYSNRKLDYTSSILKDRTTDKIYARYGVGVDVPVINNISINGDLGGYTNGLKYIGWTGSLGLRYGI